MSDKTLLGPCLEGEMSSIGYTMTQQRSVAIISSHAQRQLFLFALGFMDVCSLGAAFAFAYWLRFNLGLAISEGDPAYSFYVRLVAILIPLWIIVFYFSKLYNSNYLFVGTQEYGRITQVSGLTLMFMVGLAYFVESLVISRGWIVFSWASTTFFLILSRLAMRRIAYLLRRNGLMCTTTLVVGADAEGRAIANQLRETPTCGANVVGFLDDQAGVGTEIDGLPVLGNVSAIQQVIGRLGIEEVLLSMSALTRPQIVKIYEMYAQSEAVTLRFSPGLLELFTTGAFVREWGTVPLVSINKVRLSDLETLLKRCLDLGISIFTLIVLFPIIVLIVFLITVDSPGPIFYRRYVLGQGGRLFDALKFRTMYVDGNDILEAYPDLRVELQTNQKLKDDPRVTPVGRFLRRFSLDELPQFLNILAGQMSLVGPRMITRPEQEKYGRMRLNLLTVKPGLTGLWQVSGRSDLSYEDRVRMDMNYIRNYSIWLDLTIIIKTIPAVLRGHGAY
jgi:exopolysaccharide biosynthesis polyprenyl glycosylphosphotransferase